MRGVSGDEPEGGAGNRLAYFRKPLILLAKRLKSLAPIAQLSLVSLTSRRLAQAHV